MTTLLSRLGHAVVWLLLRSYRFRHGDAPLAGRTDGAYILAIWHQNLFAGILAQTGHPHVVMVSRSRHADPLSYVCRRLGHTVVRGSSRRGQRDKGGQEARDQMVEVLQRGVPGAITVDGPVGPAHEVKRGIIDMARHTGLPIVPYAVVAHRYWSFRTWDRFRLPKPFSKIDIRYGAPLWVAADATPAQISDLQSLLATRITALDPLPHAAAVGAPAA